MDRKRILSIMLAICIAAGTGIIPAYAAGEEKEAAPQSSFEFKKYSTDDLYKKALKLKMKSVYKSIGKKIDDSRTLPIPGLVETYTYAKGEMTSSDQFIPQGICRAGKYWLVTAYDPKKKSDSVIHAVDPESRSLVSTVVLPNRYHVGGIAFDGENIWLTGDTSDKYKGEPFLQYIKYDDFEKMTEEISYKVSKDEISEPVYIKNKPSFLEYDNGRLWAGTYRGSCNTRDAYMYGYDVIRKDGGASLNTLTFSVISGFDSSAQGVDIDGDFLYVSSSYKGTASGVKTSFITKYNIAPINEGQGMLDVSGRELKRIEVPKMNEEILVEDGFIHINFESGSDTWEKAVINTDRILGVDQSLWK